MTTLRIIIRPAIVAFIFFTIVCGVVYPAMIWGIAVLGGWSAPDTTLIAPRYIDTTLLQPRPSATDYATQPAGASQLAPTSRVLREQVLQRMRTLRTRYALPPTFTIPDEMLFTSGSGIDPHISPAAARMQRERLLRLHHCPASLLDSLLMVHTTTPQAGVLGHPVVNVVSFNDDFVSAMRAR